MIKDRIALGVLSGLAGTIVKAAIDEISIKKKISQSSFRTTAASVWLSKKSEVHNPKGQVLGELFDIGTGMLGGIGIVEMLSRRGRDHLVLKGAVAGITIGSIITAAISVFASNKVKPKDAASNLSYMACHAAYGIVTTLVAAKLGDKALFDTKPLNDYLPPTESTTEEDLSFLEENNS